MTTGDCLTPAAREALYTKARRHGLSHVAALEAVGEGEVRCWCGHPVACVGGASRLVGCPLVRRADHIPYITAEQRRGEAA